MGISWEKSPRPSHKGYGPPTMQIREHLWFTSGRNGVLTFQTNPHTHVKWLVNAGTIDCDVEMWCDSMEQSGWRKSHRPNLGCTMVHTKRNAWYWCPKFHRPPLRMKIWHHCFVFFLITSLQYLGTCRPEFMPKHTSNGNQHIDNDQHVFHKFW